MTDAHVVPADDPALEHLVDGRRCPCDPSALEVTDPDRDGAHLGTVHRHHRGGIAEAVHIGDLDPAARRFLPARYR